MAVSRRRMVKWLAGVPLALPLLESGLRLTRAQADEPTMPRRFVVFHTPNGTVPALWADSDLATGEVRWAADAATPDLSRSHILAPLAPHAADLLLIHGLDAPGPAKHGAVWVLAGEGLETGATSLDQHIADRLGDGTAHRALHLGVAGSRGYADPLSVRNSRSLPSIHEPQAIYDAIVEGRGLSESDPLRASEEARIQDRIAALDYTAQRLRALRTRVGLEDRARLDAHLELVLAHQARLRLPPPTAQCALESPAPGSTLPERAAQIADLAAMALRCDVTRVLTLSMEHNSSEYVHTHLGQAIDHHALSHAGNVRSRLSYAQQHADIQRFYATVFARLVTQCAETIEPDGSRLLDNTTLIWTNEVRDSTHSRQDIPFVIAGHGAGFRMGRYLRYSNVAYETVAYDGPYHSQVSNPAGYVGGNAMDLMLSLVRAHGEPPLDAFGTSTTELPGLFA